MSVSWQSPPVAKASPTLSRQVSVLAKSASKAGALRVHQALFLATGSNVGSAQKFSACLWAVSFSSVVL